MLKTVTSSFYWESSRKVNFQMNFVEVWYVFWVTFYQDLAELAHFHRSRIAKELFVRAQGNISDVLQEQS